MRVTIPIKAALGLCMAVGGCNGDGPSPLRYQAPISVVYSAVGLDFLAQEACSQSVDGGTAVGSIPPDKCYRFDPPRQFHGVWFDQFEGSAFVETGQGSAPRRSPTDGGTWLSFGEGGRADFDRRLPDSPTGCAFAISFVGRVTSHNGKYGHMGGSRRLVLVDRIVTVTRLPDPPVTATEPESDWEGCQG